MSQQSEDKKTHLFGEMDLDLSKNIAHIHYEALKIASACGYRIGGNLTNVIHIYGTDLEEVKIYFESTKVKEVFRSLDDGANWEKLETNKELFAVSQKTLINYKNKIPFGNLTSGPMVQVMAINELIKRYNIPAKKLGWSFDLIGIETEKQFLLWRDQGSHLEFLGIIEKEVQNIDN